MTQGSRQCCDHTVELFTSICANNLIGQIKSNQLQALNLRDIFNLFCSQLIL